MVMFFQFLASLLLADSRIFRYRCRMTDVSTARQLSAAKQALLAQRLRGRGAVATIRARAAGAAPPLSFAQERLWFMEQLVPGSAAHTIPVALRLRGALDADALGLALGDVADRHEALRMRYPAGEDGRPEVRVRAADGSRLPLRVLSAGSADAAQDLVGAAIAEPFDLATGPVARATLVRLADDDHVLALAVHHIACDGWSADILLADLFALYEARRGGRPPGFAELPVQYGDYAIRQRDGAPGAADGDFAYWERRLAALPTLDLVTDRPRPAEQTYGGTADGFRLDRTLTRSVHDLARQRDATPYMVLLAGFQVLLGRYAAQHDFAVGSPVAGRPLPELEPLVGCFVNLLTMRADLSGRPSFAALLGRVREAAADAYDHQELPFERLVQRLPPAAVSGAVRDAELPARGAGGCARAAGGRGLRAAVVGDALRSRAVHHRGRRGNGRAVHRQHGSVRARDRRQARGALHRPAHAAAGRP